MEIIRVADKTLKAVDVDFNYVADLVDAGINPESVGTKGISALRIYVAACMAETYRIPIDVREAGKLINEHIVAGGNLTELQNIFTKKCEESDFFRALAERAEEETAKTASKTTTKKKTSKVTPISTDTETAE